MANPTRLDNIVILLKLAQNVYAARINFRSFSNHMSRMSGQKLGFSNTQPCNGFAGPSLHLLKRIENKTTIQNIRSICGRENCADPCDFPPCTPENLKKTDCFKRKEKEKTEPPTVYSKYWNKPECCNLICADVFPRFDDIYYQESDKENRIYTQTWIECPPMVVKPKRMCCTDKLDLPPLCKRPRKERPKTACAQEEICPPDRNKDCPKLKMPCCREAHVGRCSTVKHSEDCVKFKAPKPSFSECDKPELKKPRITECWCNVPISMCEVWNAWRRLQTEKRR